MFGQTLAIARNTFVESLRQPVFFVLIIAGGLLQIVNTLLSAFTLGFSEETEVTGDNKLLLDMGLATVMVVALLLAAFVATSVLTREIENKTALTVISKPISRPLFILGKYLGVTGAILVAVVILTVFFLFAMRHEVMSTARDHLDLVVVLFSSLSVLIPITVAIWGNYFYGWVFSSTAVLGMLPTSIVGYLLSMGLSKKWEWQPLSTDFKPQTTIAALCVMIAIMVLAAVAVAASTRLGQVMTLVACTGVFMVGLMSNYLLGRFAFVNTSVGVVQSVDNANDTTLSHAGEFVTITLESPPSVEFRQGGPIYYAGNPAGVRMAVPPQSAFEGDLNDPSDISGVNASKSLILAARESQTRYKILNTGSFHVDRPPQVGDYLFLKPTRTNWPARVAWSVIPNIQAFWLVDAITQGNTIPLRYVGLIAVYGVVQAVMFLALAVLLFQRREVG